MIVRIDFAKIETARQGVGNAVKAALARQASTVGRTSTTAGIARSI